MKWLIAALFLAASSSRAQLLRNPTLSIPRVSKAPTIDDFLNGSPREKETTVTGFVQNSPGDGKPVTEETTAYLSYDDAK